MLDDLLQIPESLTRVAESRTRLKANGQLLIKDWMVSYSRGDVGFENTIADVVVPLED